MANQKIRQKDSLQIDFRTAILQALDEELMADDRVIFFGEDIAKPGGVFATSGGLYEKYGDHRVFDTPISELALSSAAFGSAVAGLRPVIEIMFGDFLPLAFDSLLNQSAKYWYLSNEQASIPLVVRSSVGGGGGFGPIHSQVPISWFLGIPGLKIVAPSHPNDAKALLKAAIQDDNPVLFLEHKALYPFAETKMAMEPTEKLGIARLLREGSDVTLVSCMRGVHESLEAAEILSQRGISAEVIDLRTLRPLDTQTILNSISKTRNLVAIEEGPKTGGWAGEILAIASTHPLSGIDAMWRLTTPDLPIPFSPSLEKKFFVSAAVIVESVTEKLSQGKNA
jgi:pyruvate/2-oxoglutarate/acetoin dehydrogenase E1 component